MTLPRNNPNPRFEEQISIAQKRMGSGSLGRVESAAPVRPRRAVARPDSSFGGLKDSQRFIGEIDGVPLDITSLGIIDIAWTNTDITGTDLTLDSSRQIINVLTPGVYSIYWHVRYDYDPASQVRFTFVDADWATSSFYTEDLYGQEFLDRTHVYPLALDGFTSILSFQAWAVNPGAFSPLTIHDGFVIVRRLT